MEAVPRLPMLSFKMKESPEATSFSNLKQYIAGSYQEDPESYSKEIYALECLRGTAVRPTQDVNGCATIKRYYAQLHSLQNRFQLQTDNQLFNFSWAENYSSSILHTTNIKYEMASILYNVATLHVYLGTEESRTTPESMKLACTHFQCAAWCYSHLKDNYALVLNGDISTELLVFMQHLCFAQAQECILEKSLADNRKSAIVAKVTAQIISYYNSAMAVLLTNGLDGQLSDLIGSKLEAAWKRYTKFKVLYLSSILYLYQGQDSEEQQKMGERCALYQAAFEKLEEARKEAKGMQPQDAINEALTFTMDVVEAKRKSAKSENEFIYHEEVPDLSTISAIQGANLVNGIGFDVTDPAILGEDIFHRLVPMQAHETSSLYSEEKAALLRKIVGHVEAKNDELDQFMNSLNVETLNASATALGPEKLPQGLVDRCAALSAKTNAIPDLVSSMSNLAEICTDVESMLNEIGQLLSAEERNETKYQEKVGHRPGGHISELNREYQKYAEAHNKAGESNETLRKAMGLHVANLKVLAQPLQQIQQQIPSCSDRVDETTLQELRKLLSKVGEMQQQRNELMAKLRTDVTNDDITAQVISWGDKKLDKLFRKEIAKHDHIVTVLDQNLVAQKNILRALTNEYAKCAPAIKNVNEIRTKRDSFFSSLITSYDVYEDLLGKCAKGLEFYRKLHGNVQKLLSRVRAAIDVQNEERQQQLKSSGYMKATTAPVAPPTVETPKLIASNTAVGGKPKLKDYINSGAYPIGNSSKSRKSLSTNDNQYVPTVRPSPLGSESITDSGGASCSSNYSANGKFNAGTNVGYGTGYSNNQFSYMAQDLQNQQQLYYQQMQQPYSSTASTTFQTGYTNPIYQTAPYYEAPATGVADASYGVGSVYPEQPQQPNAYYQQPQQQYPATAGAQQDSYSQNQWNQQQVTQQPTSVSALTQNFGGIGLQQPSYSTSMATPQQPAQQYYGTGTGLTSSTSQQYSALPTVQQQLYVNPTQPYSYPQQSMDTYGTVATSSTTNTTTTTSTVQTPQQPSYVSYPPQYYPTSNTDLTDNQNGSQQQQQPTPKMTYSESTGIVHHQQQKQHQQTYPTVDSNSVAVPTSMYSMNQPTGGVNYPAGYNAPVNTSNQGYNPYQETMNSSNLNMYGNNANSSAMTYNQYGQQLAGTEQQNYSNYSSYPQQQQVPQQPQQQNNGEGNYANTSTTNSNISGVGITSPYGTVAPQQYSTPAAAVQQPISQQVPPPLQPAVQSVAAAKLPAKKSSNFDLLSDIDFSMSPNLPPVEVMPLQPTPAKSTVAKSDVDCNVSVKSGFVPEVDRLSDSILSPKSELPPPIFTNYDRKLSADNLSICSDISSIDQNFDWESASLRNEDATTVPKENVSSKAKDPFNDPKILKWFHKEVERLEKFVESLTVKTLNGTTPLDSKWKELQDKLVKDESKRTVAVAKLFPDKNRSSDSIPYDHARVLLPTTTDDYINAAYVKELGPGCSTFILTQTPLTNTVGDYWNMVWSQKANTLVCLHPPNEILDPFWPQEINKEETFGDFSITLIKQFDLSHCIERTLKVTMHGSDVVLSTSMLQIKAWAKTFSSANNILGIAGNIITSYKLQNVQNRQQSPIVMNCLTGAERCGMVTLAVAAILATSNTKRPILINIIDVWYRICAQRKAALRDVNNLQLSLQVVLNHGHSILNKRGIMTSYQMKNAQTTSVIEKEEVINDPLNDLDPLWKLK